MRIIIAFFCLLLATGSNLSGQYNKIIVVKAHTKVSDYFPVKEQYRYKDFLPGKVVFKNGIIQDMNLNYNFLYGAIEFLKNNDTLAILKKKDIEYVVVQDTFYYDQGPVEIISGGRIKVGLRDYYKVKDIVKEGPYGSNVRSASADTYESISAYGNLYNLVPNETIELQRTLEYYLITPEEGFTLFTRKKILSLFPGKSDEIKAYIKSHKVNFESRDDLLGFADYLRTL
jgi:hypothetical protein